MRRGHMKYLKREEKKILKNSLKNVKSEREKI